MAVKAGTFNVDVGAIGTKYSETGLGFRPAAVFFRWSGLNAEVDSGPTRATQTAGYGFMLENGKRGSTYWYIQDAADPYTASSGISNTAAIVRLVGTGTIGKADLFSMDADGFQVVIDEVFGASMTIFYLAVSGVEFNAIEITEPGSTGSVAYTGAGFRPTFVHILGSGKTAFDTPSVNAQWCIGAAMDTGAANHGVIAKYEADALGNSDTAVYCFDTECLAICNATAVITRASLESLDSDGFHLNWLERSSTRKFIAVVATGRWYVENIAWPADTNPFTESGMTWTPEGLAVFGHGMAKSTQDTVQNPGAANVGGGESIGFGTGIAERYLCYTRGTSDGVTLASRSLYYHQVDEIYGNVDGAAAPAVIALGDINSAFSSNAISLVMDDAEIGTTFAWYFAIGPKIVEARKRLVRYQQNTYTDRAAGRMLVRDVVGRTIPNHEIQPDNWIFAGGPGFVSPVKYTSLMEDPSKFYIESVRPDERGVKIETTREGMFESLMRRLSG